MSHSDNPSHSPQGHHRRDMSGLEFFQQMMAGKIQPPPMVSLLGLRLVEVEEGRVVFVGTAHEAFYNGMGVAHGGFAATLLDTALGCAINSGQPAGRSFTTLELKINYTRPFRRKSAKCAAKRSSFTPAIARPSPRAASSTQPAKSTRTARRRAFSLNDSREINPMSDFVRYAIQDRVAVLTIDNPPVNALGPGCLGSDRRSRRARRRRSRG